MRLTPKLIVAGAITGLTDVTHAYGKLLEILFGGTASSLGAAAGHVATFALAASTIFAILHSLKYVGRFFAATARLIFWIDEQLEALGNWIARSIENAARRALLRVAKALRHASLRLSR